eukprot:SAG31_NODE_19147_length_610_cov_100.802348_1_plen_161_part_10
MGKLKPAAYDQLAKHSDGTVDPSELCRDTLTFIMQALLDDSQDTYKKRTSESDVKAAIKDLPKVRAHQPISDYVNGAFATFIRSITSLQTHKIQVLEGLEERIDGNLRSQWKAECRTRADQPRRPLSEQDTDPCCSDVVKFLGGDIEALWTGGQTGSTALP